MQIVGCFTRSRQLMDALRTQSVDVVVMDYSLSPGEVDGLNLIRGLRLRYPGRACWWFRPCIRRQR